MNIKNGLEQIFFPEYKYCLFCGSERNLINDHTCADCEKLLSPVEPFELEGFDIFCAYEYKSPVSNAIHKYKYNDNPHMAKIFARILFETYSANELNCDCVSFVPLHWLKKSMRGFDQAELLAKEFSEIANIEFLPLLKRKTATPTQTKYNAAQRKKNIKNAFVLNADAKDLSVLLIDDVITTGSTMLACAKLIGDSAKNVICMAIAYA